MQRILGEAIQYELKDPRIGFATVVTVEVSGDIQHARVLISVMGTPEERDLTMAALQRARGFLRRRVAEELGHMRFVPDLTFALDTSLDYSIHIADVLRTVERERAENPPHLDDEA